MRDEHRAGGRFDHRRRGEQVLQGISFVGLQVPPCCLASDRREGNSLTCVPSTPGASLVRLAPPAFASAGSTDATAVRARPASKMHSRPVYRSAEFR
jgi:hypothetical protein